MSDKAQCPDIDKVFDKAIELTKKRIESEYSDTELIMKHNDCNLVEEVMDRYLHPYEWFREIRTNFLLKKIKEAMCGDWIWLKEYADRAQRELLMAEQSELLKSDILRGNGCRDGVMIIYQGLDMNLRDSSYYNRWLPMVNFGIHFGIDPKTNYPWNALNVSIYGGDYDLPGAKLLIQGVPFRVMGDTIVKFLWHISFLADMAMRDHEKSRGI